MKRSGYLLLPIQKRIELFVIQLLHIHPCSPETLRFLICRIVSLSNLLMFFLQVFLISDYVVKICVEGGLESSVHGLGTEVD